MKSLLILLISTLLLLTLSEGKTVKQSSKKVSKPAKEKETSNLLRFAKSVAFQAISDLQEESRRNPRFGINLDFGNLTNAIGAGNGTGLEGLIPQDLGNLTGVAALAGIPISIKVGSFGIKSAIIAGLVSIKAFIINVLIILLTLAFLASGTAYFICNLGFINCSQGLGGLGGLGQGISGGAGSSFLGPTPTSNYGTGSSGGAGSGFTNPLNFFSSRSGFAQEAAQPIYKAIDEGYKKFQ